MEIKFNIVKCKPKETGIMWFMCKPCDKENTCTVNIYHNKKNDEEGLKWFKENLTLINAVLFK